MVLQLMQYLSAQGNEYDWRDCLHGAYPVSCFVKLIPLIGVLSQSKPKQKEGVPLWKKLEEESQKTLLAIEEEKRLKYEAEIRPIRIQSVRMCKHHTAYPIPHI